MPSVIHKIDWLFDTDIEPSEWRGSIVKIPYPYPAELAEGFAEHIEFHDGISLVKDFHHFINEDRPAEIPLGRFTVEPSTTTLVIHMMHKGSMITINHKNNDRISRVSGFDLFGRTEILDVSQILLTDEDIHCSILFIPENQLIKLLGSEEVEELFKNLGLLQITDYCQIKVPDSISMQIANCTPSHLSGGIRQLFANSVILQYLVDLNIYISSAINFKNKISNAKFDLIGLHTELLQISGVIPTLNDIAKKYGVSPAKMNQAFFEKYGQSIYNFLSNQRLKQAHYGLLKTDIPMKTIAHKIGYSHVNHFITAFKNKFGVTPGSLRKENN